MSETPVDRASSQGFSESRFGAQAVGRLRAGFNRSLHPMLIADDQRRWVFGNAAACELLGVAQDEIPWRTMDEFTPPAERSSLDREWKAFLASGEAEGEYQLYFPDRGLMPVEFSATANVLPARHLAVFVPPEEPSAQQAQDSLIRATAWASIMRAASGRTALTRREREVMALIAAGHQSANVAERLFLSPETVKSHVQNALGKLGAHTRAHAVAIALVTGEIVWDA